MPTVVWTRANLLLPSPADKIVWESVQYFSSYLQIQTERHDVHICKFAFAVFVCTRAKNEYWRKCFGLQQWYILCCLQWCEQGQIYCYLHLQIKLFESLFNISLVTLQIQTERHDEIHICKFAFAVFVCTRAKNEYWRKCFGLQQWYILCLAIYLLRFTVFNGW